MRPGFIFAGVHCNDIGVGMRSTNRQILPDIRDTYLDIPGHEGSYLFAGANADRYIEVEICLPTVSLIERQQKARQVAAWLRTKERAELIFDDEPGLKYMAKIASQLDLEILAYAGKTKTVFRCLPFACELYSTVEDIILDSYAVLDSDILLNAGDDYIISL